MTTAELSPYERFVALPPVRLFASVDLERVFPRFPPVSRLEPERLIPVGGSIIWRDHQYRIPDDTFGTCERVSLRGSRLRLVIALLRHSSQRPWPGVRFDSFVAASRDFRFARHFAKGFEVDLEPAYMDGTTPAVEWSIVPAYVYSGPRYARLRLLSAPEEAF